MIAVRFAVIRDRRFHAAAQVFEVALKRRARDFELTQQLGERHHLARSNELFNLENAFGFVHAPPLALRGATRRSYFSTVVGSDSEPVRRDTHTSLAENYIQ